MKTFPMFLQMAGRRVVIIGGGETAAQKTRLMLKTDAQIDVVAHGLGPELQALADAGRITWVQGPITRATFDQAALVFIGSGCPGLDASIYSVAKAAGVVVNVVDQPHLCDAITPSIVDRDPVVVAIGTEGTAPVLGRQIKTRLEEMLEPRLGGLAALAGRLRDLAAQRLGPRDRRDLWRWVFGGPIRQQYATGDEAGAARALQDAIETGSFGAAAPAPVSLVGAGPGCQDLITLRGVKRLQEADVIYYDRLVDPEILELARRDAERVYVGKAPGRHAWPQDQINQTLVVSAKRGLRVVRLKSGDPGIFARGAEEAAALTAAGIAYDIVPGVTAASSAAAAAGGFLTQRDRTRSLVLTTGTASDGGHSGDWLEHLKTGAKVAVYMGVNVAEDIAAQLAAARLSDMTEITLVSNAQRAGQTIAHCTGGDLIDTIADHAIANPAIIFLQLADRRSDHDAVAV